MISLGLSLDDETPAGEAEASIEEPSAAADESVTRMEE